MQEAEISPSEVAPRAESDEQRPFSRREAPERSWPIRCRSDITRLHLCIWCVTSCETSGFKEHRWENIVLISIVITTILVLVLVVIMVHLCRVLIILNGVLVFWTGVSIGKPDPCKVLCSLTADNQWWMTKRMSWAGMFWKQVNDVTYPQQRKTTTAERDVSFLSSTLTGVRFLSITTWVFPSGIELIITVCIPCKFLTCQSTSAS